MKKLISFCLVAVVILTLSGCTMIDLNILWEIFLGSNSQCTIKIEITLKFSIKRQLVKKTALFIFGKYF